MAVTYTFESKDEAVQHFRERAKVRRDAIVQGRWQGQKVTQVLREVLAVAANENDYIADMIHTSNLVVVDQSEYTCPNCGTTGELNLFIKE